MPLQATSGAASYDGFGGGVPFEPTYIEQVFATHLYTGNGSTQTITNGIDLSTKGGLVWMKDRTFANSHQLYDTARGVQKRLMSDSTSAQGTETTGITAFNINGWTMGAQYEINDSASRYASWTFRKQPKFFDLVTYTGNGTSNRAISHSLGSAPGCVIVKRLDAAVGWNVYHRGVSPANNNTMQLNTTAEASSGGQDIWGNGVNVTTPTETAFYVAGSNNNNGSTYVAYLFAHNAGGFGLTGTDNVISCGSYTGNSGAQSISLGYEPQWLLVKNASSTADWVMYDNMRGIGAPSQAPQRLFPNTSGFESAGTFIGINATGFMLDNAGSQTNASGNTYIYIAIRRGPMKTPTTGASVFAPEAYTGTSATRTITSGFPVDLSVSKIRSQGFPGGWFDRLRGALQVIRSSSTDPEVTSPDSLTGFDSMTGVILGGGGGGRINTSPDTYAMWNFRRAPGFFDVVCYTGSGSNTQLVSHNLGVNPELVIQKRRDSTSAWYTAYVVGGSVDKTLLLNSTAATGQTQTVLYTTTSAIAAFDNSAGTISGATYVAYLFASCPGVSKVGSYTGTGALQTINCGFTGGARFVLIKRTDSTGDWYCWDSSRGIVSGNDPYLLLNSTAAEVTNTDYIDTYSAGFEISSTAPAAINANGGSFVFLAIS